MCIYFPMSYGLKVPSGSPLTDVLLIVCLLSNCMCTFALRYHNPYPTQRRVLHLVPRSGQFLDHTHALLLSDIALSLPVLEPF